MSILTPVPEILDDLQNGKMIILMDDEKRENEGDLIVSASKVTPEHINFMATYGRGLICLAMSGREIDRLQLPQMTDENGCKHGTAFTVSIDAIENVGTGISAFDRAETIRRAADPASTRQDFRVPGHIFPLRARDGGLLERAGHTEAGVELSVLAGCGEAAVLCEIMNDDGTMARLPDLRDFAARHGLRLVSVRDVMVYMDQQREKDVA